MQDQLPAHILGVLLLEPREASQLTWNGDELIRNQKASGLIPDISKIFL
jgi:hypothetical protein